jgi:uncharacterized protein
MFHHKNIWDKFAIKKWMLIILGIFFVGLGIAGIFIPLLPTTPFLLLAAACFMKSSKRLYNWLVTHKWFGSYIRNYREYKAIPKRTKIATLIFLWGTIGYTSFAVVTSWIIRLLLLIVSIGVTVHILSIKTLNKETLSMSSGDDKEVKKKEGS